jgi:hypothetical protein
MRISIQAQAAEKIGHQDQEYKYARLPVLLGARPAAASTWYVSSLRPTSATEPKKRQLLFTSWIDRTSG